MVKYQSRLQMMGTFIDLVIYHQDGERLIKEIYHLLNKFSERFTVNQPESELMTINKNAGIAPVVVEHDLFLKLTLLALFFHPLSYFFCPFTFTLNC